MNKALLLPFIGLAAMYCNCTQPLAGGSSQQGNGVVVGCVISTDGSPAIATRIRIRPDNYVQTPEASSDVENQYDAVTDSTGSYSVTGIYPGNYVIEANDRTTAAALLEIAVQGTIDADTVELKPYSRITGTVDETIIGSASSRYIQVLGLERLVQVDEDGSFALDDLPEADFDLQCVSSNSTIPPVELFSIKTLSGDTTEVVIPTGWRYSHRLYLNTTSSGADVVGDVVNFPVLVRLTRDNFDFRQTKGDGTDIRFTTSDNSLLPYEIERWDAVNMLAEIWVRMDTIHGGDSTQLLVMNWGNDSAVDSSNGRAVFDTTNGFSGVWHLGESGDSVYDATGNAFNGQNNGSTATVGIIGDSRMFSNGSHIKISGMLNSPSDITLSAWVRSDTSAGSGQEIISLGDAVLIRLDDRGGSRTTGCYYTDTVSYTMISSGKFLAGTGWHYLTLSINSTAHVQKLYIDGAQSAISNNVNPINYSGLGADTYIGIHGNGKTLFNTFGMIDEVRVNSIPLTPDWIKLCFMNEKAQDALVRW